MKCMVACMMLFAGTMGVMAQKNIDKVVEELEKSDEVAINSMTKRDPKTRQITRVIKTFSLTDIKMAKRLIAAFEKDEEYAISAVKDMPKGRKSAMKVNFTFTFQQDNEKSMYSLSTNENGKIDLSINVRRGDSTGRDVSLNWDLETDKWSKDLDGLVDELGCIVSNSIQLDEKNNRLILEGDVYIDGKKIKQGNYEKNGREVIVQ
ncbi:MAG: DUF5024 domain-containing protein, partial [Bacteroidaceae bacterium]|nr:DUF5024 domain-containing protein [Bacteroidaceae bacterium]